MKETEALFNLRSGLATGEPIEVRLEDMAFKLNETDIQSFARNGTTPEPDTAYLAGKGGFKKAYQLPDGRAVILINLDVAKFNAPEDATGAAKAWLRAVKEEKDMADRVREAGLLSQQFDVQELHVGDASVPVLVAQSFEALAQQGVQVRDQKNPYSSAGTSEMFGTVENARNPEYMKKTMSTLLDDVVKMMTAGLSFGGDTVNLAVTDTPQTPEHDRSTPGLFTDRKQELHLFLFDFSAKQGPRSEFKPKFLDEQGNPDRERIRRSAERHTDTAFERMTTSMTEPEIARIAAQTGESELSVMNRVLDPEYEKIKDSLVEQVVERVVKALEKMPMEQRLARFDRPENSPPLDLPGNGRPQELPLGKDQERGVQ